MGSDESGEIESALELAGTPTRLMALDAARALLARRVTRISSASKKLQYQGLFDEVFDLCFPSIENHPSV